MGQESGASPKKKIFYLPPPPSSSLCPPHHRRHAAYVCVGKEGEKQHHLNQLCFFGLVTRHLTSLLLLPLPLALLLTAHPPHSHAALAPGTEAAACPYAPSAGR